MRITYSWSSDHVTETFDIEGDGQEISVRSVVELIKAINRSCDEDEDLEESTEPSVPEASERRSVPEPGSLVNPKTSSINGGLDDLQPFWANAQENILSGNHFVIDPGSRLARNMKDTDDGKYLYGGLAIKTYRVGESFLFPQKE